MPPLLVGPSVVRRNLHASLKPSGSKDEQCGDVPIVFNDAHNDGDGIWRGKTAKDLPLSK